MTDLRGARFHITGIVQGVGFRPFIYSLATRYKCTGWVRNTSAGVDIEVDGTPEALDLLIQALKTELPPLARIDSFDVTFQEPGGYADFEIVHSEAVNGDFQPISPDVCICPDCLRELFDPNNRRYRYPFINCTNCGPRFTIITDIPYDRPKTTMAGFPMCSDCAEEYQDPLDRRFHAQPVACPVCGPKVWLEMTGKRGRTTEGNDAFEYAKRLLREGKILAIKGLGGFHLACDATNPQAVDDLRNRKLRVDKPFALMMSDIETIEQHCFINSGERLLLESRPRPIMLLRRRPGSPIVAEVAPKQDTLGVMLPYTPLHYLLLTMVQPSVVDGLLSVLVMTSGNFSEEPIATDNREARRRLSTLADAFLMHNRDIHTRCDDSVVRVFDPVKDRRSITNHEQTLPYILRRSRGYAPNPIQLPFDVPPILAAGPELKNTFCLTRDRYAFLSHHIGDMENYETLRSFEESIVHFENLFRIKPKIIAYDFHPNYLATRYALKRAEHENLPTAGIQHHHAHIAACMAEHGLTGEQKVIGVSFDGTGYGTDGTIWGGEFLLADYAGFERMFHLDMFPLPGGDAAIKRPARTALALLWHLGLAWDDWLAPAQDLCYEEQMALRVQLERGLNAPKTSSMGRMFDAIASLAGGRQKINYEAQAAIEFETAADQEEESAYRFDVREGVIFTLPIIQSVLADIRSGISISKISARFHHGVAEMVSRVCQQVRKSTRVNEVALSGGVWQNMLLLNETVMLLQASGFNVLIHRQVPANDGGVALGQALVASAKFRVNSV